MRRPTLSRGNHAPHVYGLKEADGVQALVLELAEGT